MTDGPTTDDLETAWLLGREAGLSEVPADANPYRPGSDFAADWADGWREGANVVNRLMEGDQAWAAWMTGDHQTGAS